MAGFTDSLAQLADTLQHGRRLHFEHIHSTKSFPDWMAKSWTHIQHNSAADNAIPVLCISPGCDGADVLCQMKLRDLWWLINALADSKSVQRRADELDAEICRLMTERHRLTKLALQIETADDLARILGQPDIESSAGCI